MVASRVGIAGDLGTQRLVMREPTIADRCGHSVSIERLAENGQPPIEVPTQDRMGPVRHGNGSALVLDVGAEVHGGVLVLERLHPLALRVAKEKPDHQIVEAAIDELVDDPPKRGFPPDVLEIAQDSSSKMNAVVASNSMVVESCVQRPSSSG